MSGAGLQAHDDLQARIWNDERMQPGTREVALAMAWVLHHEPESAGFNWKRLREMLGCSGLTRRDWRVHDLIAGDAPRYEDARDYVSQGGECEGPRLRPYKPRRPAWLDRCAVSEHHPHLGECRYPQVYGDLSTFLGAEPDRDNRICGAHATIQVTEYDMATGWKTARWFCARHRWRAAEVRAMLSARGKPPEPIPNTGGTLPRYFAADWAAIYRRHCEKSWTARRIGWEPPYHGVDADDWPVPGKTLIPKRPRLSLVSA